MTDKTMIIWDQTESIKNMLWKYLVDKLQLYNRIRFTIYVDREYKQVAIYIILDKYSAPDKLFAKYKNEVFMHINKLFRKYGINKIFQQSSRYSEHSMIREFFLTLSYEQITELYYCLKAFEDMSTEELDP